MNSTEPADGRAYGELAYKFALTGELPDPVKTEIRASHDLWNRLTEIGLRKDEARRKAWEGHPAVAPLLAARAAAQAAWEEASDAYKKARTRTGYAKRSGKPASVVKARKQEEAQARQASRDAAAALKQARERVKAEEELRKPEMEPAFRAADAAERAEIEQARREFCDQGTMYWATYADVLASYQNAVNRVIRDRERGIPARLRFKAWDGSGTIAVQLQREKGVTMDVRARVHELRAAGAGVKEIAEDPVVKATGLSMMTLSRMVTASAAVLARIAALREAGQGWKKIAEDPVVSEAGIDAKVAQRITQVKADPPRSPAVLASGQGKWKNTLRVSPLITPEQFASLRRGDRVRLARTGKVAIRTGNTANLAVSEIGAVIHRPMDPGTDVATGKLTVSRTGPDLHAHVSLSARVPLQPAPPPGGRIAVIHTGWRVLPDGALRVAVITGAPARIPADLAGRSRRGQAKPEAVVREHGGWQEVVIPAAWREEASRLKELHGERDLALEQCREKAAAWLAEHPGASETLPSAGEARRRRSPRWLGWLGRACAAGEHGDAARPLGEIIVPWADGDLGPWRGEAYGWRRLTGRRNDAWAMVADWVTREGTSGIITDEWSLPRLARRPADSADDDPQAAAARANRVLAAPGELRLRIRQTAGRRSVPVAALELRTPARQDKDVTELRKQAAKEIASLGSRHHGCGGELDPDLMRKKIVVPCPACGQDADQDLNMAMVMRDRAAALLPRREA